MNNSFKNTTRIIAIPFAGGNKHSFNAIEKYIPRNMNWITLELPGRGARFKEQFLETVSEMVEDLIKQLTPYLMQGGDYVLYGHSMGTLLGYELTKKIIQSNLKLPLCLVFTGRGAPCSVLKEKKSNLPKEMFWKKVNELGGLPKEILETEELLDLYYPILKSDFKAIENYHYIPLEKPLPIPIYVCLGKDEIGEGDDKTSLKEIGAWKKETNFTCKPELLEGDHFFIFKHPKAIVQQIENAVMMVKMYRN